jgi:translation initiation factor 1 (eIF-1/SUI1)
MSLKKLMKRYLRREPDQKFRISITYTGIDGRKTTGIYGAEITAKDPQEFISKLRRDVNSETNLAKLRNNGNPRELSMELHGEGAEELYEALVAGENLPDLDSAGSIVFGDGCYTSWSDPSNPQNHIIRVIRRKIDRNKNKENK